MECAFGAKSTHQQNQMELMKEFGIEQTCFAIFCFFFVFCSALIFHIKGTHLIELHSKVRNVFCLKK